MTETHNVVAVSFDNDSAAYQALSQLKNAAADGRIDLRSAAIVRRDQDGRLSIPEGGDTQVGAGWTGGSLVGMLVGVLGGPVGMLVGWGTGALIGGLLDIDRASHSDALLGAFSRAVPPGATSLVAEVVEPAVEVVDGEMAALGGTVVRRPAGEVLSELEAAQDAAEAAADEARRVVREQKKQERKDKFDDRVAALKAKLGGGE
jgi:uncharacterized membrane protein